MAANSMNVSGIAGRYATALFDLAIDEGALDQTADDMASLGRMIADSADLHRLVRSPVIGSAAQLEAIDVVMAKAQFGSLTQKFVGLVSSNRRLFALPSMVQSFAQLMASHRGEIAGEVISAHPMSAAQLDVVRAQLKSAVGSDVQIDAKVDPSLLGGLIVKIGSRMIDSSLRTKLQNLKFAMKGAG